MEPPASSSTRTTATATGALQGAFEALQRTRTLSSSASLAIPAVDARRAWRQFQRHQRQHVRVGGVHLFWKRHDTLVVDGGDAASVPREPLQNLLRVALNNPELRIQRD